MTPAKDATPEEFPTATIIPPPVGAGPRPVKSDRDLEQDIPYGVRIAAAWAWRIGLILLISGALVWLLAKVSFLIIPVMVAALLAGLLNPV